MYTAMHKCPASPTACCAGQHTPCQHAVSAGAHTISMLCSYVDTLSRSYQMPVCLLCSFSSDASLSAVWLQQETVRHEHHFSQRASQKVCSPLKRQHTTALKVPGRSLSRVLPYRSHLAVSQRKPSLVRTLDQLAPYDSATRCFSSVD